MIIAKKITINILQILIYLLPITFILGNLIINIFILLISILGVLYFKKNLLDFKDKKIIYFISSFFLLLLFSTLFELFVHGFYPDWIKTILYLRFFLLLLVIKALVSNGLLNLNYFFKFMFFYIRVCFHRYNNSIFVRTKYSGIFPSYHSRRNTIFLWYIRGRISSRRLCIDVFYYWNLFNTIFI